MPLDRPASMDPLRRSRSASMSSLSQVNLSTLDQDIVLDYARKVMQLQPQPATTSEKLQMLFALSQKLLKWFLEDRERVHKCIYWNPLDSDTAERTVANTPSLNITKVVPQCSIGTQSNEIDKPTVASRVLASAVTPVTAADMMLPINLDFATQRKSVEHPIQSLSVRPADLVKGANPELVVISLPSFTENESLLSDSTPRIAAGKAVLLPEEPNQLPPPKLDALQVYLQVQRAVICIQKYIRGFMARRRFFRALEELLRGSTY